MKRKLAVVLFALGGIATAVLVALPAVDRKSRRTESENNIRILITLMVDSGLSAPDDYPRLSGRNFILSLVASGRLKPGDTQGLEVLWPPNAVGQFNDIDPSAYKMVTWESLKARRFPHLTGYAGPSTTGAEALLYDRGTGTPLIADLTDPDGIIVGFSSGIVRFMSWAELGVDPPEGPVVVGPNATSPLLRALSVE